MLDRKRDIYIWGAGSCGRNFYNGIIERLIFKGFIDSDPQKQQMKIDGLNVFGLELLSRISEKPYIIIASTWAEQIEDELKARGFAEIKDYIKYNDLSRYWDIMNKMMSENTKEKLISLETNYPQPGGNQNGAILVIGENNPVYFMKLKSLFLSIDKLGGFISRLDRVVVFMDTPEVKYQKELEMLEVKILINSPVNRKFPHNNKIRLLEQDLGYEWYIMLDHDTIVCRDFSGWLRNKSIKAKPVDVAIIDDTLWKEIYLPFNLEIPTQKYMATSTGEPTLPFFNSGVLIIPGIYRKTLYDIWLYYIQELISKKELVQNFTFYIDEIAFALALQKAELPIEPLPVEMNFHTHIPVNELFHPEVIIPSIIHYHHLINESGFIKPSYYPGVQQKISEFNELLKQSRRLNFNNEVFWDFRYAEYQNYGSGLGSRGETLLYKQNVLKMIIDKEKPETVLDIGCGDQFVSSVIPDDKYVGIDLSKVIIEKNSVTYPNRTYINADFLNTEMSVFDLTLCFDVLIHIDKYDDYRCFIERIIQCTRKSGIISGFEDYPATYHSELTFYHEPLSKTLLDFGAVDLKLLGTYRDLQLWYFTKKTNNNNVNPYENYSQCVTDNDVSDDVLTILRSQSENVDLLDQLVKISRDNFGFFAKHTARAFEYVWLANLNKDVKGKNILDIGTGVNPLPILFALLGANVYTLDNSKKIRIWEQERNNWNEWGYLDYGKKYSQIHSFNVDVMKMNFPNHFFDYIYSISVIEHMPASARNVLWSRIFKWIKGDGQLYLTIDLYKNSDDLWNYCYGEIVEDRKKHGTLNETIEEAKSFFDFHKVEVKRDIYALEKLDIATLIGNVNNSKGADAL